MNESASRVIIVSNRLPVSIRRHGNSVRIIPSSGGLVRALAQALKRLSGVWIGWPGVELDPSADAMLRGYRKHFSFSLHPVPLSQSETNSFYYGFSNEIIWPLFHDLQSRCNFDPDYWGAYKQVNRKFAHAISQCSGQGEFVWVHDYHLAHVAEYLRNRRIENKLGFFLHIPFPSSDIFEKLPWRAEYLKALLQYDLVGFQTLRDRSNFIGCVRAILPEAAIHSHGEHIKVLAQGRQTIAGSFPIGIDFQVMAIRAGNWKTTNRCDQLRQCLPHKILLGVDRLDYTKGIPERLKAIQYLLRQNPDLHRKITLVQVVVPSREAVPKYQELKRQVERLVSVVNGEFAEPGWTPVQYLYRTLSMDELLAYYRASDIALVTPLKDGMNLVAKEFCAAHLENDGVLILSEFAGAAAQLQDGALLVNPYDTVAMAETIQRACVMEELERKARMEKLRSGIRAQDVFHWLHEFQTAANGAGMRNECVQMLPFESPPDEPGEEISWRTLVTA